VLQPIAAFDPSTGDCLTIQEATQAGVFDKVNSKYVDPESGENIPLSQALERGLVKAKPFYVKSVKNPHTNEQLTFDEAVSKGILDCNRSLYIDPVSNKSVPFEEALEQGLVKAEVVQNPVYSVEYVLDKVTYECYSIDDDRAQHLVDLAKGVYIDPVTKEELPLQKAIKCSLAKAVLIYIECVVDPITGEELSLEDAVIKSIIDIPKGVYLDPKEVKPIPFCKAVERGLIKTRPINAPVLCPESVFDPESEAHIPLDAALEKGLVDHEAGIYKDTKTGEEIPLDNAIKLGLVECLPVCVTSVFNQEEEELTLLEAIEQDLIDIMKGLCVDPSTGDRVPILVALNKEFIKAVVIRNPVYCAESVLDQANDCAVPYETAIEHSLVDLGKGVYFDIEQDIEIPLQKAIEQHFVRQVPYHIEFVVDPVTSRELTLEEAVVQGLIDIPRSLYLEPNVVTPSPLYKAIEDNKLQATEVRNPVFSPETAYDPVKGRDVSIQDAVEASLVDLKNGIYKESNDKEVTMSEAFKRGLMTSSPVYVASVLDSETSKEYTLAKAVELKLVDITKGVYNKGSEAISLSEAVAKDLVKTVPNRNPVYAVTAALDTKSDRIVNIHDASEEGLVDLVRGLYIDPDTKQQYTIHKAIEDWFLRTIPTYISSVVDPDTDENIPLEDAAEKGVVNLANNTYIDPKKIQPLPLSKAQTMGLVKSVPITSQVALETVALNPLTGQEHPYKEAVKLGLIDEDKDLYTIPKTKEQMSLETAREKGLVSEIPACLYCVFDPEKTEYISLEQAVDQGLIDPNGPKYKDTVSSEVLPLQKAIDAGLVKTIPARNPIYVAYAVNDPTDGKGIGIIDAFTEALVDLSKGVYQNPKTGETTPLFVCKDIGDVEFIPFCIASVYCPSSGEELSLSEAVERGVIDLTKSIYNDPLTIEPLPLLAAIADRKVTAVPVCSYVDCIDGVFGPEMESRLPVDEAVKQGMLDLPDADLTLAEDDEPISLAKAREEGYLTETPLKILHITDPYTDEAITLEKAVKMGVVDLANNSYIDPLQSEIMPLLTAYEKGLVSAEPLHNPVFCPEQVVDTTNKLQKIPIAEAVKRGIIQPESGKYCDPSSGEILTIKAATKQGFVVGTPLFIEAVTHPSNGKALPLEEAVKDILDVHTAMYKQGEDKTPMLLSEAVEQGYVKAMPARNPVKVVEGALDPKSGKIIPIQKALEKDLLNLVDSVYVDPKTHQEIPLKAAIRAKKVKVENYCVDYLIHPLTGKELTLAEGAEARVLDLPRSLYLNHKNETTMPIKTAIEKGYIKAILLRNPVLVAEFLLDSVAESLMPIEEAVKIECADLKSGLYTDPGTHEGYLLREAIKDGVVKTKMFVIESAHDPMDNSYLELGDAVKKGIVDITRSTYTFLETDESIPLISAIEQGLVRAILLKNPVKVIQAVVHKRENEDLTMEEAVEIGLLDIESKTYNMPENGEQISFQDATEQSLLKYATLDVVYALDPRTGKHLKLEDAVKQDVLDLPRSLYLDQKTGEAIPLTTAIKKGLVKVSEATEEPKEYPQTPVGKRETTEREKKRRRSRNSLGKIEYPKKEAVRSKKKPSLVTLVSVDAQANGPSQLANGDLADEDLEKVKDYVDKTVNEALRSVLNGTADEGDMIEEEIVQVTEKVVHDAPWSLPGGLGQPPTGGSTMTKMHPDEAVDSVLEYGANIWGHDDDVRIPELPSDEVVDEDQIEPNEKVRTGDRFPELPQDGATESDIAGLNEPNPDKPGLENGLRNRTIPGQPEQLYSSQINTGEPIEGFDDDKNKQDLTPIAKLNGNDNNAYSGPTRTDINTKQPGIDTLHVEPGVGDHSAKTFEPVSKLERRNTSEAFYCEEKVDEDGTVAVEVRRSSARGFPEDVGGIAEKERPGSPDSIDSLERPISPDSLSGDSESESTPSSVEGEEKGRDDDEDSLEGAAEKGYRADSLSYDADESHIKSDSDEEESKPFTTTNDSVFDITPTLEGAGLKVRIAADDKRKLDEFTCGIPTGVGPECAPRIDSDLVYKRPHPEKKDLEPEAPGEENKRASFSRLHSDPDSGIDYLSPTEEVPSEGTPEREISDTTKVGLGQGFNVEAIVPESLENLQSAHTSGFIKDTQTPDSIFEDSENLYTDSDMYRRNSDARPVDTFYKTLSHALKGYPLGVKSPQGGLDIGFDEAVANGVLKLDPLEYRKGRGEVYCIQEAAALGYVDKGLVEKMLPVYEAHSLDNALQDNKDYLKGHFKEDTDKLSRGELLAKALKKIAIDAEKVFYHDYKSHRIGSLSWAMTVNRFDPKRLHFIDPKTNRKIELNEAEIGYVMNPRIDTEEIIEPIATLKFLKGKINLIKKGIQHPIREDEMTVKDAVLERVLDLPRFEIRPLEGRPSVSLPEALSLDLVERETANKIGEIVSAASLGDLIDKGLIATDTANCKDPKSGRSIPFNEAIKRTVIKPQFVFFLIISTKKVTSFQASIRDKFFSPVTCTFKDPKSQDRITIAEAIRREVICPYIDVEKIFESHLTIRDLLDRKAATLNTMFRVPSVGYKPYPLNEALGNGVVNEECLAKIDPEGSLSLSIGDIYTTALEGVVRSLEWVANTENSLASRAVPEKTPEALKEAIAQHRVS
jgi:hypothetical protein